MKDAALDVSGHAEAAKVFVVVWPTIEALAYVYLPHPLSWQGINPGLKPSYISCRSKASTELHYLKRHLTSYFLAYVLTVIASTFHHAAFCGSDSPHFRGSRALDGIAEEEERMAQSHEGTGDAQPAWGETHQ